MTIGPAPMIRMVEMSVRFGIGIRARGRTAEALPRGRKAGRTEGFGAYRGKAGRSKAGVAA
jgi:hypothetical protein